MEAIGRGSRSGDGVLKNGVRGLILGGSVSRRNGEHAANVFLS